MSTIRGRNKTMADGVNYNRTKTATRDVIRGPGARRRASNENGRFEMWDRQLGKHIVLQRGYSGEIGEAWSIG